MNSTTAPKATEPDDVLVARADERLVHAYAQIARADEQLARLNEQLSKLENDAARQPSAVVGRLPSRGRPALRGVIGLLLAACIFVGAFVLQSSYGDAAKSIVAPWMPEFILTSSLWMEKSEGPTQPSQSSVQLAAATPVIPQPTASAQAAPQDVASTVAPAPPDLAQLLQTMARDLANLAQGIEQLKANQEQAVRENAKVAEQLKTNQEQMTRLTAKASEKNVPSDQKASEQNLRPRTSGPPQRPVAAQKPAPAGPSPQARARPQPQPPTQLQPDDQ
jgi:hypothetical protein